MSNYFIKIMNNYIRKELMIYFEFLKKNDKKNIGNNNRKKDK